MKLAEKKKKVPRKFRQTEGGASTTPQATAKISGVHSHNQSAPLIKSSNQFQLGPISINQAAEMPSPFPPMVGQCEHIIILRPILSYIYI